VHEGEFLAAGAEVALLVDPSRLEGELLLDPIEAADAVLGAPVVVSSPTQPGTTFEGRVTFVGDVLDPRSSRLPVRVTIEDPGGLLRPGAIAEYAVAVGPPREVATVPEHAVTRRLGHMQVFVVVDGVARARSVVLGGVRDGNAEILEGLDEGERVVVEGLARVIEGRPVRVVVEAGDEDEGS
jgi:RND family efflux transporter MFP subunit